MKLCIDLYRIFFVEKVNISLGEYYNI